VLKARVEHRICTSFLGGPGRVHPENFWIYTLWNAISWTLGRDFTEFCWSENDIVTYQRPWPMFLLYRLNLGAPIWPIEVGGLRVLPVWAHSSYATDCNYACFGSVDTPIKWPWWKIKTKHVIEFGKIYSFYCYFKIRVCSTKPTNNRGLKMGYFCYILSPMAGIDRAIIIMAQRKLLYGIIIFHINFETYAYMFLHILSLVCF
jgi:hypothetical protein